MGYKILGINLSHNSSVCVLDDGEIVFFLEEDRLSRFKYDSFPVHTLEYISSNFKINEIALSGLSSVSLNLINYSKSISFLLKSLFPSIPIKNYLSKHHFTHAYCAFLNSSFSQALTIVIDGNGSPIIINEGSSKKELWETESIFSFFDNNKYNTYYQSFRIFNLQQPSPSSFQKSTSSLVNLTKAYEAINYYLELGTGLECGKTMGLSSYGEFDPSLPLLIQDKKGTPTAFKYVADGDADFIPPFDLKIDHKQKIFQNLAYHIQQETQQAVGDYIEEFLDKTNQKNVVCSGGYFLNCVANYYLKKRFPNINFYFEPISSDAGTAIGAAKLVWQSKTEDTTIRPQKTLYYGPKYSKEELLKGIKKYLD